MEVRKSFLLRMDAAQGLIMIDGSWGGDCAGISPKAEGRVTQWLRGCGAAVLRDFAIIFAPHFLLPAKIGIMFMFSFGVVYP